MILSLNLNTSKKKIFGINNASGKLQPLQTGKSLMLRS
jgi:hypothetical protein